MRTDIGDLIDRAQSFFEAASAVRRGKAIFPIAALAALAGCAIHPVQQDVTHLRTVEVVDRIRCETQRAIQDKAIDLLINLHGPDSPAAQLGRTLSEHRELFRKFPPAMLPSQRERKFYDRYINTAIAMEFSFDITENGGAGFTADAVRLISGGTAGVVAAGSDAVSRNNIRRFLIAETFGELLDLDIDKLDCTNQYLPNFQYPIAGNIGMGELISTFIDLNQDKDLSPTSKDGPEVFGDTLKFSTTLMGSLTPHVVLAPIGNRWGVDPPTNIGLSAGRVDIHQLTIGLSIGKPPAHGPATLVPRTAFSLQPTLRQTGNANKNRAIDAIENQHVKNFYDRAVLR